MMRSAIVSGVLAASLACAQSQNETGQHPGWPRWCGKVYEPGYPAFEPGGETTEPAPINSDGSPNLYVQLKPRHSIYLAGEGKGSFVVNAALSPWYGEPWTNSTTDGSATEPFTELFFSISLASDNSAGGPIIKGSAPINATAAVFDFDLSGLEPRLAPYDIVLFGNSKFGEQSYMANSSFRYLPDIAPGGSATKIDNLNGGLLFRNAQTGGAFEPLLPYGFYGLYNGSNSTAESQAFVSEYSSDGKGLNGIISLAGFADTNPVYNSMDASSMRFMFDLRSSYKNLTDVEQRVNIAKNHSSLFAYWTADEPDGWQVPFEVTPAAQELIHELDPYHPVAVTLNCQDYYFGEYSGGGDILMADPYPIAINSTFSKWGTACNTTLGDCGCDNCKGNVQDVSSRLDDLIQYEKWLGRWPLPKFINPQAFYGEDYWFRYPTTAEAFVMNSLAFNRGVAGTFAWTWPTSQELFEAHSQMAAVVTNAPVRDFLLGGQPDGNTNVADEPLVDVAYWVKGGQMMVSVVNGASDDLTGPVTLGLPVTAASISAVPFGGLPWGLSDGQLTIETLPAMSASFVILDLK
ncbi:uncharacterized protein F4807DRAFT_437494 [Annulohypoxylon truncatum]|uniref:uncharacterized protein n=1 Tax=Annulohypoxylon truncatum TaxID=327061 RepID=UPI002008B28F|nr:uncharacterized protein F4807DRAFT_437494 [Annulohypoxylon truncatum]KAI1206862.1 hypothetical protein F4807DRAFT_437494 [Annulohypoxylon truncatum]